MAESGDIGKVIDKARKLLQLRGRAATPGEAQAAARVLALLLDKHRLQVADLELQGAADPEAIHIDERPLVRDRLRIARWQSQLIGVLCEHYGVARWRRIARKSGHAIHLCGRSSDIEMVRYMFGWLTVEAERIVQTECAGQHRIAFASWRDGFVQGIEHQLLLARQVARSGSGPAGLVLRDRFEQAEKFMEKNVKLSPFRRRSKHRINNRAHLAGMRRGKEQHLGPKLQHKET